MFGVEFVIRFLLFGKFNDIDMRYFVICMYIKRQYSYTIHLQNSNNNQFIKGYLLNIEF